MESYTTMTINFNNSEAANKAMNIIKAALKTITPKFPTEFTTFEKDITVKENEIIVDESCSLWQAIGRVDVLAKEVATKLADEDFTLECYYDSFPKANLFLMIHLNTISKSSIFTRLLETQTHHSM